MADVSEGYDESKSIFFRHDTNLIFVFATLFSVSNMAAEWFDHVTRLPGIFSAMVQ